MDPHSDHDDTHVARLLHAAGRLPLSQLTPLLQRIRVERQQNPGASLSGLLVHAGLVTAEELRSLRAPAQTIHQPQLQSRMLSSGTWAAGNQFAGYQLEGSLGGGAMGELMRARQLATGRVVALKRCKFDDPDTTRRFAREAKALAAVDDHPNVVRIFEAGEVDGQGFLAMELLEGGDLSDRLKRGPLTVHEAAEVVIQLARGLGHVHDHGILHRDLKPENVVFDTSGTPKLADFGLAKIQDSEALTRTGQMLGTPGYMAPEQALGLNELDERTDVYGLGAVLYSCLTGRVPFQGQMLSVLKQVLTDPPRPPSELRPDLDPALEALCLRALEKEPERRFPSAGSFAEALESWGRGSTSRAQSPLEGSRPGRGTSLVGVLGVVLGVGLGLGASFLTKPEERPVAPPPPALPSPEQGTSPGDPPAPEEAIREYLPGEIEPGSLVLVPVDAGQLYPLAERWEVGVVAAVEAEGGAGSLEVLYGGQGERLHVPLERVRPRRDGFGVGARAWARDDGHWFPCRVRKRRGPFALIEFPNGDADWTRVTALAQSGPGVDPGADAEAEVVLAPRRATRGAEGVVFPGVVLDRDSKRELVLVAFLSGGSDWVAANALRPLPDVGAAIVVTDQPRAVRATLEAYVGTLAIRFTRDDGEARVVYLGRLAVESAE